MTNSGGGSGSGELTPGSGIDPELAALSYEAAREQLADVVRKLEAGGLSLEDSLALWERGEALAKVCDRHLAGARERVEQALASVEGDERSG
ncbi:exodeoxyribonuclease VII small subunit [Allokutzneria oryzae]|uniref:Exodeoxyribonuclease 7 small subunit n=1 Tax=Allokutzneria oryzae TaxID=1378989 RepID=A0ABV6A2A1_9PSEU